MIDGVNGRCKAEVEARCDRPGLAFLLLLDRTFLFEVPLGVLAPTPLSVKDEFELRSEGTEADRDGLGFREEG